MASTGHGEPPRVSVIVPARNARATITETLESLAAQRWSRKWELIVADNASRDGTEEAARLYEDRVPRFRIVHADARMNASHARNVGAAAAAGRHLVFVDADDLVAPGWLSLMGEALETHRFVACRYDLERLNPAWLRQARGEPQSDGLQKLWYPPYAIHAGGTGLGIRRSLHEAVGGFDESYSRVQDTDYCIRVQRLGVELHFVREAVLHYRHRRSIKGLFRQASLWAEYNERLYRQYREPGTTLKGAWRAYLGTWKRLLKRHLRGLIREGGRRWWYSLAWQSGWYVGLLLGCIRYRVPPVMGGRRVTVAKT